MASSSAEWPVGWIISDLTEYWYTAPLLGPNTMYDTKLGSDDDLNFAVGEMDGKRIYLVHAPKEWHAYAGSAMKQRFGIKIMFIGGTYETIGDFPAMGNCILQMPEIDERRYDRLARNIPADDLASLERLGFGLDRFIVGAKEGHYNLELVVHAWTNHIPGLIDGLDMPGLNVLYVEPTYPEWPRHMDKQMCCGQEFNSGSYSNQTPCLKVLAASGQRGNPVNHPMWHKWCTLASAAAISRILINIAP